MNEPSTDTLHAPRINRHLLFIFPVIIIAILVVYLEEMEYINLFTRDDLLNVQIINNNNNIKSEPQNLVNFCTTKTTTITTTTTLVTSNLNSTTTTTTTTTIINSILSTFDLLAVDNFPPFVWYFKEGKISLFEELNMKTWQKAFPKNVHFIMLNESNINHYIPDLPKEFFKLPYAQVKSDVARAGALYNHGGIYLDTDFIALNFTSFISKLSNEGYDLVSYGDYNKYNNNNNNDINSCDMVTDYAWSSNCMGTTKKTSIMEHWWENIKDKLTRICNPGEYETEKVCCYEKGKTDIETCHIPYGYIEHLKALDHDNSPYRPLPRYSNYQNNLHTYCFNGNRERFMLDGNAVFFSSYTTNSTIKAGCFQVDNSNDLDCSFDESLPKLIYNFFGRQAYHLFSSNPPKGIDFSKISLEELLHGGFVISELYKRILAD